MNFVLYFDVRSTVRFFQKKKRIYISGTVAGSILFQELPRGLSIRFFLLCLEEGASTSRQFLSIIDIFSSIISSTIPLGSKISVLVILSFYIIYNKQTWNQRDGGKEQGGEEKREKLAKAWAKLISNQALSNKAPSRVDSLALHCISEKDSNCFPSSSGGVDPLLRFPCRIFFHPLS